MHIFATKEKLTSKENKLRIRSCPVSELCFHFRAPTIFQTLANSITLFLFLLFFLWISRFSCSVTVQFLTIYSKNDKKLLRNFVCTFPLAFPYCRCCLHFKNVPFRILLYFINLSSIKDGCFWRHFKIYFPDRTLQYFFSWRCRALHTAICYRFSIYFQKSQITFFYLPAGHSFVSNCGGRLLPNLWSLEVPNKKGF